MQPLIIVNVEQLEGVDFLTLIAYGREGENSDVNIYEYHGDKAEAIKLIAELSDLHGYTTPLVYTSTKELYLAMLHTIGLAPYFKPRNDTEGTEGTEGTKRLIETHRDVLIEVHQIEPQEPTEEPQDLSKWRQLFINLCDKCIGALNYIKSKLGG